MSTKHLLILFCLLPDVLLWGMKMDANVSPAQVYFQKGEACFRDSNWIGALENYGKMISLYEEHPVTDPVIFAKAFSKAGNICQIEEQYVQALDFYILGLKASDSGKDETIYNRCLGNIGNIYLLFKDYETALLYYNKGYDRSLMKGDVEIQAAYLSNMIETYCYLHQPAKAKACYRKLIGLPLSDAGTFTFYNLINQALIAQTEKNYSAAVYFHKQALEYAGRHIADERFIASEYIQLSKVYKEKGEIRLAIESLKKAEELATRKGYAVQVIECYKLLSHLYSLVPDSSLAGHYSALYVSFSDSIDQREYNKVKNKLVKFEERQNNSYIGKLSDRINVQRWIIVFVTTCFLVVLILIIYIVRQNKKLQHAYHTLFNRNSELIDSDEKYRQIQLKYLSATEQLNRYCQAKTAESDQQGYEAATGETEELSDKKFSPVLSSEYTEKLLKEILKVMDDQACIFNPGFSLNELSKLVNSNTKYVSWVINDTYNKNFRTFLNEYRIREASKRLLNTEKYGGLTIQGIAKDVGFKSVTNFVVSFKKNVGITPSLYQKMARKDMDKEKPTALQ